ncbi:unnamed protein product [Closterium sp. NIES-64]|nr:unnamed protein product [Closterium sp. NIES-64]
MEEPVEDFIVEEEAAEGGGKGRVSTSEVTPKGTPVYVHSSQTLRVGRSLFPRLPLCPRLPLALFFPSIRPSIRPSSILRISPRLAPSRSHFMPSSSSLCSRPLLSSSRLPSHPPPASRADDGAQGVAPMMELKAVWGKTADLSTWVATNPCATWQLVQCWTNGYIRRMEMSYQELFATLPSAIGALTQMEEFFAVKNWIYGDIPNSFSNLVKLKNLQLYQNFLNGTIPASMGRMTSLYQL